ncbi:MAG: glycosyltransferase family 4 protein [Gemmataceae bacterium]
MNDKSESRSNSLPRPKVLLITEVFPPKTGGSGRWFWEIYRRLPREDFVIAAGQDPRQGEFDATHDLHLMRLPLSFTTWGIASISGLRQYIRTAWSIRRIVTSNRTTMLHCGKCLPEGLLAWILHRFTGLPYLCYVHGEELNLASGSRELAWLTRRVLRGAHIVIANSRNTIGILKENWGLSEESVRLLHPGVDTDWFVPAEPSEQARKALGWSNRTVLLTVGRLQKRKGHDHLIMALKCIKESISDVLYGIVGDGAEMDYLKDLTQRHNVDNYVQFLGELNDEALKRCYQQCDLFVLPNRQVGQDIEGFGMVLLEAQACGKPVVAGTSGGTVETMDIPNTGLVVDCEDPETLAKAIISLLQDGNRLHEMAMAARPWTVKRFDWKTLAIRASELFSGQASTDGMETQNKREAFAIAAPIASDR